MISTVDPEARHGHKSRNRRFDGYKAHLSIDPDSELIDEVVATPANTPTVTPYLVSSAATTTTRTSPSSSVTPPMRTPRPAPSSRPMASSSSPSPRRSATQRACSQGLFIVDTEKLTVTCPADHVVAITVSVRVRRKGELQDLLRKLPDAPELHDIAPRAHDHDPPLRGHLAASPQRTGDPAWKAKVPGRPPHRRAQDRPLHPQAMGRAKRQRTRGLERVATDLDTRAGRSGHDWRSLVCITVDIRLRSA